VDGKPLAIYTAQEAEQAHGLKGKRAEEAMTPATLVERERRHPTHDTLYELEPEIRAMVRFAVVMVMATSGKSRVRLDPGDEDDALHSLSCLVLETSRKVKAILENGIQESKGAELPEIPRRAEFGR
jgi:hypothetical protein